MRYVPYIAVVCILSLVLHASVSCVYASKDTNTVADATATATTTTNASPASGGIPTEDQPAGADAKAEAEMQEVPVHSGHELPPAVPVTIMDGMHVNT